MRYFRVQWTDAAGTVHFSDPMVRWTDAELYRRAIGIDARIVRY